MARFFPDAGSISETSLVLETPRRWPGFMWLENSPTASEASEASMQEPTQQSGGSMQVHVSAGSMQESGAGARIRRVDASIGKVSAGSVQESGGLMQESAGIQIKPVQCLNTLLNHQHTSTPQTPLRAQTPCMSEASLYSSSCQSGMQCFHHHASMPACCGANMDVQETLTRASLHNKMTMQVPKFNN